MSSIRILIVEDDSQLLPILATSYRKIFASLGYVVTIEQTSNVADARQLAKAAHGKPYDFVSLDVNLGDGTLTGLNVLETFNRFRSAWMVALLTGVESDAKLDATLGRSEAEDLRKKLRRHAYANFPAERLMVVEKPSPNADDAQTLLSNRLIQIALVYDEVARLRYVFRPIEVAGLKRVRAPKGKKVKRSFINTTSVHWQIRFNCGEIRTLPDMAGFQTLHRLLALDRTQSVTPEEALMSEPKTEKAETIKTETVTPDCDADPLATYFEAKGITWKGLPREEQDTLIRAALSLRITRYVELRELQDDEDVSPAEGNELDAIKKELGPLVGAAERAYQSITAISNRQKAEEEEDKDEKFGVAEMSAEGLHLEGGNYDRIGNDRRGWDSPGGQAFRARMKRVRDCLRENGFDDFATHIEKSIQSANGKWSYNQPNDIEWTT